MICNHNLDHTEPAHKCDGCCNPNSILYKINHQFDKISAKPTKQKTKQKRVREREEDGY